jgi:hypothetical protein
VQSRWLDISPPQASQAGLTGWGTGAAEPGLRKMWSDCLRVLLLWTETMTKPTLIRTFNWGWLTGWVNYHQGGNMAASRQAWCRRSWEFYIWRLLVEDWLPAR